MGDARGSPTTEVGIRFAAERRLREMRRALKGDPGPSDDFVREATDDRHGHLKTNCDAAARAMFAAIAPVCHHRPYLIREMFSPALRPLVYLGFERADRVASRTGGYLRALRPCVAPIRWAGIGCSEPRPIT